MCKQDTVPTLINTFSMNHLAGRLTNARVNSGPVTRWFMTTGLLNRPCTVKDDFLRCP